MTRRSKRVVAKAMKAGLLPKSVARPPSGLWNAFGNWFRNLDTSRGAVPSGRNRGVDIAPMAVDVMANIRATINVNGKPQQLSDITGPGIRVSGSDLYTNQIVASGSTANGFNTVAVKKVTAADLSPRLALFAEMYQYYAVRQLKVTYVPFVGTTTGGSLAFAIDMNEAVNNSGGLSGGLTQQAVMEYNSSALSALWSSRSCAISHRGTKVWNCHTDGATEAALDTYQFELIALFNTAVAAATYGALYLEFVIDFYLPEPIATSPSFLAERLLNRVTDHEGLRQLAGHVTAAFRRRELSLKSRLSTQNSRGSGAGTLGSTADPLVGTELDSRPSGVSTSDGDGPCDGSDPDPPGPPPLVRSNAIIPLAVDSAFIRGSDGWNGTSGNMYLAAPTVNTTQSQNGTSRNSFDEMGGPAPSSFTFYWNGSGQGSNPVEVLGERSQQFSCLTSLPSSLVRLDEGLTLRRAIEAVGSDVTGESLIVVNGSFYHTFRRRNGSAYAFPHDPEVSCPCKRGENPSSRVMTQ